MVSVKKKVSICVTSTSSCSWANQINMARTFANWSFGFFSSTLAWSAALNSNVCSESAATGTPTVESPAHRSGQEDVLNKAGGGGNNLDSGSAATGKRTVHAAAESPASTCSFSSSVTEVRKVDQSVQPFISDGEYDGYSISDGVGGCEALRQARELLSKIASDLS